MKYLAAFLLLVAAAVAGYFFLVKKEVPSPPLELKVFFTCDTRGRLVPCGCFSGQLGGLTRLKTVLDKEAAKGDIRVDVGDAIKGAEDFNCIEYKYILQAYSGMGFDALNLGHREAQLSLQQLRELKTNSPVALLSANLLDQKSGQPIFDGYKIIQRGKYRVALVGVLDPRGLGENLGAGLAVEKMDTTLSRLLPELKPKADILILLAFTDEASLARLAQDFYEFDLILGGKVSQPSQKLEKQNRSLILYTTNESRALGILRALISGRGQMVAVEQEIRLMVDTIPEDPAVIALAAAYRAEIRNTRLTIDDPAHLEENRVPGVKIAASYAGSETCLACHPTAAKKWRSSDHARAFATLVGKKADADPNCILCHAVGFGSPSGYRRAYAGQKFIDVGCESCHGPGSLHVTQRQSQAPVTFTFRPLGQGDCQKCHYGEFSRPFDYVSFWPRIAHGKETR
jgi:hypothetical protein